MAHHPLDPLTGEDLRRVAAVLRRGRGAGTPARRFASIALEETPEADLEARRPGPWEGALRDDLRPSETTQPDGASFTVAGSEVSWQRRRLRVGFSHREGLTLEQVTHDDRGEVREVAHRTSFTEMVVPHRDPSFDHCRRTACASASGARAS